MNIRYFKYKLTDRKICQDIITMSYKIDIYFILPRVNSPVSIHPDLS